MATEFNRLTVRQIETETKEIDEQTERFRYKFKFFFFFGNIFLMFFNLCKIGRLFVDSKVITDIDIGYSFFITQKNYVFITSSKKYNFVLLNKCRNQRGKIKRVILMSYFKERK